ncbi:MAG TPA: helix-turn-helix domain-containing protein [Ferruginibacter sp.]|nr:helix-turn-helix domain-containing protein [Ferruginibacter sp.]
MQKYSQLMQHIEFFHTGHFEHNYHRVHPAPGLEGFIDFFWETKFDELLQQYPEGFSDALFPNIGYTYLINLGTPFVMQVGDKKFNMKTDGFLPRNKSIECYHREGNKLFGIKFKISPIIFKTRVNFAEYREYIYPLSYLMEPSVIEQVKRSASFEARIEILNHYFQSIIKTYSGSWEAIRIVTEILQHCDSNNDFTTPVEEFAKQYKISARTLHRYFETSTSLSSKKALQILRIRKAVQHLSDSPADFNYDIYGYYDYSHFCKHLKKFLQKDTVDNLKPHLQLLQSRKMNK